MVSALENIFFVVLMISLIVAFAWGMILLLGWITIMCADALKEYFKNKKE